MIAVAFRPVQINLDWLPLSPVVFMVALLLIYLIWLFVNKLTREPAGLKLLREFTENGPKINSWLKEHKEELQRHPVATLNNPEFVDLINRDQVLYERILEIYPNYPDTVMPPKELRQYLIELVQGQHKQTH